MRALLISLLWACGGDPGTSPEDGPGATFEQTTADLAATMERHGHDVAGATELGAIGSFEDDYWGYCQSTWDTMSSCMDAFGQCGGMGGGGMMGSMNDWDELTSDVWSWMQDHHDAMAACSDVACCHDEENRWQDQMTGWMDQVGSTDPAWSDDCGW